MCRKNHLHGWSLICLGIGILLGHSLESFFLCCCGGIGLIMLGCWFLRLK